MTCMHRRTAANVPMHTHARTQHRSTHLGVLEEGHRVLEHVLAQWRGRGCQGGGCGGRRHLGLGSGLLMLSLCRRGWDERRGPIPLRGVRHGISDYTAKKIVPPKPHPSLKPGQMAFLSSHTLTWHPPPPQERATNRARHTPNPVCSALMNRRDALQGVVLLGVQLQQQQQQVGRAALALCHACAVHSTHAAPMRRWHSQLPGCHQMGVEGLWWRAC